MAEPMFIRIKCQVERRLDRSPTESTSTSAMATTKRRFASLARAIFGIAAILWMVDVAEGRVEDWNGAEFDAKLSDLQERTTLVFEYYASWCPHCQRFVPEYARLGAFFASEEAKRHADVVVARADCATNRDLCTRFGVRSYPTVRFGSKQDFQKQPSTAKDIPRAGSMKAESIAKFLAEQMQMSTAMGPALQKSENFLVQAQPPEGAHLEPQVHGEWLAHHDDLLRVTVDMFMDAVTAKRRMVGDMKEALLNWTEAIKDLHPEPLCRKSLEQLIAGKDAKLFPPLHWRACHGVAVPQEWVRCGGFTCGAWLLFHVASVRMEDKPEAGRKLMDAIVGYVKHFFPCEDCKQHFLDMAQERRSDRVKTQEDAMLWLWSAHNAVNARLEKPLWPPKELCPRCYLGSPLLDADQGWNQPVVLQLLQKVYSMEGTPLPPSPRSANPSSEAKQKERAHSIANHGADKEVEDLPRQQSLMFAFALMLLACFTLLRVMSRSSPIGKRPHSPRLTV